MLSIQLSPISVSLFSDPVNADSVGAQSQSAAGKVTMTIAHTSARLLIPVIVTGANKMARNLNELIAWLKFKIEETEIINVDTQAARHLVYELERLVEYDRKQDTPPSGYECL